jgi:prephenate dehydrogenase
MESIRKLVVVGVGLIGGSFAAALRRTGRVAEIVGMGRTRASLEAAAELGVIDRIGTDWGEALAGAELVLLGMPVGQMEPVMCAVAEHLDAHTLVTDAGSTKQDVVAAAYRGLGTKVGQFVPSHPIAGAEKSGVRAAKADLFRDRRVVLTPVPENPQSAIERVRALWQACGAVVSEMTARDHDLVFAAVSHLPHVLAFALVEELAARDDAAMLFSYAAGGFRDFTRIAGSHPEMWRDICLANRAALLDEIDAFLAQLQRARHMIEAGDAAGIEALFERARRARNEWASPDRPSGE